LAFLLFCFLVLLLALFQPTCFRFCLEKIVCLEVWFGGGSVQIGAVEGSIFQPIILRDTVWSYRSSAGPIVRCEIANTTAVFSWHQLLPYSTGQCFQELQLRGVVGKVELSAPSEKDGFLLTALRDWWPLPPLITSVPEYFQASDVDWIVQSGPHYLRFLQTNFQLSSLKSGLIQSGQIILKQPWSTHTFRNVTGATAIQEGIIHFTDLTLDSGIEVVDFSTSLRDLAEGRSKFALKLAAFGGDVRLELQAISPEPRFSVDLTVKFLQIDLAKLATFLGVSDAAGGTIKTGKLNFLGPLDDVAKVSADFRIEVANFQWENRQWDSLVLGAKLHEGRCQIPELSLTQGRNRLALFGEMTWPSPGVDWWRSEFFLNIKEGQLDDLTALSALLLPEFRFAAGRATIRGSVRGKDQKFDGQLVISGSQLRWRNAPIEKLDASIILHENEYQLSNISLRNGADYLSGSGVLNIVGDKQYWGEVHASVQDLAKYQAILRPPLVPESLSGGAFVDWDGEGSAKGSSGRFLARLRKVRSLGATAVILHPINAEFEGSYSRNGVAFSTFLLADDESSFTARVGLVDQAVSLQNIRIVHGKDLWLEGDAILPLKIWRAWPNTSLATLLDDQTVAKLHLIAHNLSLRETAQLTGFKFPIEGLVRGSLFAEGPLGALQTSGNLTITKGRIPLGWSGQAITEVDASGTFSEQILRITQFTAQHPAGDFKASGQVDFSKISDPAFQIAVTSKKSAVRLFESIDPQFALLADLSLDLRIAGPLSDLILRGESQMLSAQLIAKDSDSLRGVLFGELQWRFPSILPFDQSPWHTFHYAVHTAADALQVDGFQISADLLLAEFHGRPALAGYLTLTPTSSQNRAEDCLSLQKLRLEFSPGAFSQPIVSADIAGCFAGEPFTIALTGFFPRPIRIFSFQSPLTETSLRSLGEAASVSPPFLGRSTFGLLVPEPLRKGVDLLDWSELPQELIHDAISTPTPAPTQTLFQ
jgi:hypothetical protein